MTKAYVYLSAGSSRDLTREIRGERAWARVAFHGCGDGSRSLEVHADPRGFWSVEHRPGPTHGGSGVPIARGCLPGDYSALGDADIAYSIDPHTRETPADEVRAKVAAFDAIAERAADELNTREDLGACVLAILSKLKDGSR